MSGQSAIWLDGCIASALPLPDRGLDYGDGLFETLLLRDGQALFSDLHLERLQRGLQALAFPDCIAAVRQQIQLASAAVSSWDWRWGALRLTVTRGCGPRGYAPPIDAVPRVVMVATELEQDCNAMRPPAVLSLAEVRLPTQPALAGLKHLNRLEQVMAAGECQAAGTDETVMRNQAGAIISVAAGNLFLVRGQSLLTAPLHDCGIAGTRRQLLMQRWAPAIGLAVEEAVLQPRDLESADEALYSNALVGLRPVASFAGRNWSEHQTCEALFRLYQEDIG